MRRKSDESERCACAADDQRVGLERSDHADGRQQLTACQRRGAALVQTASGNFLVARTAQDSFTALTAVCTHEACTVTGFENQHYVCPCHGSQYTTSGAVVQGPAPSPLRQFATRFAGNVLTIAIA